MNREPGTVFYDIAHVEKGLDFKGRRVAWVKLTRTCRITGHSLPPLELTARLDIGAWEGRADGADDDVPEELIAYVEKCVGIDARGAA